mgnify:CR=1 FL=1
MLNTDRAVFIDVDLPDLPRPVKPGFLASLFGRPKPTPADDPRIAIEAGVTEGWHKYTGAAGAANSAVIGIDRYGESAPAADVFKYFGFTVENVVAQAKRILGR